MEITLFIGGIYLFLGALVTLAVSGSPYRDNGWVVTTLLWPVFFFKIVFG